MENYRVKFSAVHTELYVYFVPILELHSRDEADMLMYKTIAKCRSSFA